MAKSFLSRYLKDSTLNRKLRFPAVLLAIFLIVLGVCWIIESSFSGRQIKSVYNATRSAIYLTEIMDVKSELSQHLQNFDMAFGNKIKFDDAQKITEMVGLTNQIEGILKRHKEEVAAHKEQIQNNEKLLTLTGNTRTFFMDLQELSANKKLTHQIFEKKLGDFAELNRTFNATVLKSIEQMRNEVISIQETNKKVETLSMAAILLILLLAGIVVMMCMALIADVSQELNEMSHMADVSSQVNYVSENIGLMGQALAERVSQQATALDESVSSMEEMSTMIAQTVKSTESALRDAESVQKESDEGLSVIQDLQRSMNDISASNVQLESIYEVIKQITTKTAIINEIVFETRLLSFNASIEAARAGQHGRGFAVVAEEVGNLAKMSGKAAQEIKELLERSVTQVNKTVKDISERVKVGQKISMQCGNAFNTVSGSINKLTPMVNSIANAAREQETGIKQVNRALEQMESVTNKNAQSAEELSSWATKLRSGSDSLMGEIDKLKKVLFGMQEPTTDNSKNLVRDLERANEDTEADHNLNRDGRGGGFRSGSGPGPEHGGSGRGYAGRSQELGNSDLMALADQEASEPQTNVGLRKPKPLHLVPKAGVNEFGAEPGNNPSENVHELKSYRRDVKLPKANDPRFK